MSCQSKTHFCFQKISLYILALRTNVAFFSQANTTWYLVTISCTKEDITKTTHIYKMIYCDTIERNVLTPMLFGFLFFFPPTPLRFCENFIFFLFLRSLESFVHIFVNCMKIRGETILQSWRLFTLFSTSPQCTGWFPKARTGVHL